MNKLSAIRTFQNPGFSPVRGKGRGKLRIFDNRFYMVTFQNMEVDTGRDYIGLADGEYTELLPGRQAREAREAHLNHCNAIVEYTGPVYSVILAPHGYPQTYVYAGSEAAADNLIYKMWAEETAWLASCQRELSKGQAQIADEPAYRADKIARYPLVSAETLDRDVQSLRHTTDSLAAILAGNRPEWTFTIDLIRP